MTDAAIPEVVLNTREMTIQNSRKIQRSLRPSGGAVVMGLYLLFLMLPIYWLLNMSLKTKGLRRNNRFGILRLDAFEAA